MVVPLGDPPPMPPPGTELAPLELEPLPVGWLERVWRWWQGVLLKGALYRSTKAALVKANSGGDCHVVSVQEVEDGGGSEEVVAHIKSEHNAMVETLGDDIAEQAFAKGMPREKWYGKPLPDIMDELLDSAKEIEKLLGGVGCDRRVARLAAAADAVRKGHR